MKIFRFALCIFSVTISVFSCISLHILLFHFISDAFSQRFFVYPLHLSFSLSLSTPFIKRVCICVCVRGDGGGGPPHQNLGICGTREIIEKVKGCLLRLYLGFCCLSVCYGGWDIKLWD